MTGITALLVVAVPSAILLGLITAWDRKHLAAAADVARRQGLVIDAILLNTHNSKRYGKHVRHMIEMAKDLNELGLTSSQLTIAKDIKAGL